MKSFGMKQPSILDNFISSQKKVSIDELIGAGRSLTVDQFLEAKREFDTDRNLREGLIRDRETFVVYKNDVRKSSRQTEIIEETEEGTSDSEPQNIKKQNYTNLSNSKQDFGVFSQFLSEDKPKLRNFTAVKNKNAKK